MRRVLLLPYIVLIIASCKNPKPDYAGVNKMNADDFLKAFQPLKLPVTVTDTSLDKFSDSVIISREVFAQFIPDSVTNVFINNGKTESIIHPAGIIHKKENDFLLVTFSSAQKMELKVFVLDDKHKFLASFPLISNVENDKYNHSISITDEPTFILKQEKISTDNKSLYSRTGFAFNAATNSFNDVLHDSNEDTLRNNEIVNPIDTLLKTNKFSGDYSADAKNFISVRDGKSAEAYVFYIHFEKNNGGCVGELKGEMRMTNNKEAVFTENGAPCVINFKFSNNSIKIKEQGNCGNHRGITCPFDFTFKKKIQPNKKSK